MCLVVYSDVLPRMIHDELMKAVEGVAGQSASDFADVLHRHYMADGRILLGVLHKEGMIKKIPAAQVLVTPNNKSNVRLDELNSILNEMAKGEEAVKRLADIDASRGYTGKKRVAEPREVGMPANSRANAPVEGNISAEQYLAGADSALSDADLAQQRVSQAATMRKNAESMLAEAARLEAEATNLHTPATATNGTRKTTKIVKSKATKKQEA